MRLFLAVDLGAAARAALFAATARMRAAAPTVRWTPREQLHLTLKFIGEQAPEIATSVAATVASVTRAHAAFPLELRGLGAFPDRRRPRILWAGIAPEPRLELLFHEVELACASLGLPLDGRAFRPHVTVGRADRADATELAAMDRAAREAIVACTAPVRAVDLMQSELTPRGARHVRLATAPLGGS